MLALAHSGSYVLCCDIERIVLRSIAIHHLSECVPRGFFFLVNKVAGQVRLQSHVRRKMGKLSLDHGPNGNFRGAVCPAPVGKLFETSGINREIVEEDFGGSSQSGV